MESVRLVSPRDINRLVIKQDDNIEKQVNLVTFADKFNRKNRYTADRVLVVGRYSGDDEK